MQHERQLFQENVYRKRRDKTTVNDSKSKFSVAITSVNRYNEPEKRFIEEVSDMLINDRIIAMNLTKYRLSKESGVPQATINDICSGKADLEKCSAGTLFRLAKVLGVTIEDILLSATTEQRSSFETFKSNTCHQLKDIGDIDFMIDILKSDKIRILYDRQWYPEAFYLLAMLDYLSRENDVPLCTKYNDIRAKKLSKPLYPTGVLVTGMVLKSDEPAHKAEADAIPEFRRFNIIESEVRNVV